MGLKSSTLLQEEDIEEIQNETGCKFILILMWSRNSRGILISCKNNFAIFSVSPNQIRRLYCRFSSLDKATKGTLRFVQCWLLKNHFISVKLKYDKGYVISKEQITVLFLHSEVRCPFYSHSGHLPQLAHGTICVEVKIHKLWEHHTHFKEWP